MEKFNREEQPIWTKERMLEIIQEWLLNNMPIDGLTIDNDKYNYSWSKIGNSVSRSS